LLPDKSWISPDACTVFSKFRAYNHKSFLISGLQIKINDLGDKISGFVKFADVVKRHIRRSVWPCGAFRLSDIPTRVIMPG